MKCWYFLLILVATGCHYREASDSLVAIQIQDRNGITETISTPNRLEIYTKTDFLSSQPYKKVLRVYKREGKSYSKITTYHPNGLIWQYLEAEEMRAYGTYKEWYSSGKRKLEARVIGGTADVAPGSQRDWLFDGMSQVWNEQEKVVAQILYSQGELHGKSLYFYPDGKLEKELTYSRNVLQGDALEYYPNETLRSKSAYERGIKQGLNIGFFDREQKAWIEEYRDNLLIHGSYYDREGNQISEVIDGHGFQAVYDGSYLSYLIQIRQGFQEGGVKHFNSQGETVDQYHMKNGKKQGEEIFFFLSSERENPGKDFLPKLSIHWEEDQIHGPVKTWYNNGQLQSQREYAKNKRNGPSLTWYRDGSLMMLEEYEGNRLVKGQYFKKNGNGPVSTISNGNGAALLFDEQGVFLRKIIYAKGEPINPDE